jgi:hypothetical protein
MELSSFPVDKISLFQKIVKAIVGALTQRSGSVFLTFNLRNRTISHASACMLPSRDASITAGLLSATSSLYQDLQVPAPVRVLNLLRCVLVTEDFGNDQAAPV